MDSHPVGHRQRVIVLLHPTGLSVHDAQALARSLPVLHSFSLVPGIVLHASASEIAALSRDARVRHIWPDLRVRTCLNQSAPLVGAPPIWRSGWMGDGVRVCLIDTGLDLGHPDFAGRIDATHDFTGEGIADRYGHGTHVAGIAVGSGAASNGTYRGIAPKARIMVAKALGNDGAGDSSKVLAALEWAVQQKAQVINMSLGLPGPSNGDDPLSLAVDAAVHSGVIVCVAAGNDGPSASTVGSPGATHKGITVGATSKQDVIASFSSRGPTQDGRVKPDLTAPGVNIVSCRAQGTALGTVIDGHYMSLSGTSMATPHVAGAMALLRQACPQAPIADLQQAVVDSLKKIVGGPDAVGQGRLLIPSPSSVPTSGGTQTGSGCLIPATILWSFIRMGRAGLIPKGSIPQKGNHPTPAVHDPKAAD